MAVGGLFLSPVGTRVGANPGSAASIEFELLNPGERAVDVTMNITGFMPVNGSYESDYNAKTAQDASRWFGERTFHTVLAPGATIKKSFAYRIPSSANGVYWAMVVATPKVVGSASTMSVVYESPAIFMVGKQPRPAVRISTPTALARGRDNLGANVWNLALPIENTSRALAVITATGELRKSSGQVIGPIASVDKNVLPKTQRNLFFQVPTLPDGQYSVTVTPQLLSRALPPVRTKFTLRNGKVLDATQSETLELPDLVPDPSGLQIPLPPGGNRSVAVRIVNTTTNPVTFSLSTGSVEQNPQGIIGGVSGELPPGVVVEVPEGDLQIGPRGSRTVRVNVRTSAEVTGDRWFSVFLNQKSDTKKFGQYFLGDVLVKGRSAPKLELTDGKVDKAGALPVGVGFTIRNTGSMALRMYGEITLLRNGVQPAGKIDAPPPGEGGIIPGATLTNMIGLPKDLTPGQYVALINYQFGEKDFATLRVPFEIPSARATKPVKLNK